MDLRKLIRMQQQRQADKKKLRQKKRGDLSVIKLASPWGGEKEKWGKAISEEQMTENFPELMKDRNSEIQIPIFPEWFYDTDCNMNMLIEDGIRKVTAILNMDSTINSSWIFFRSNFNIG